MAPSSRSKKSPESSGKSKKSSKPSSKRHQTSVGESEVYAAIPLQRCDRCGTYYLGPQKVKDICGCLITKPEDA